MISEVRNKTIVVFAPHHDDESIGIGGIICKLSKAGNKVHLVVATSGGCGIPGLERAESCRVRDSETLEAAKTLGIDKVIFMNLRDHTLEFNFDSLSQIVKYIRKLSPDIIFTTHPEESDRDHRILSELVKEGSWLAGEGTTYRSSAKPAKNPIELKYYEVWTPMSKIKECVDIDEEVKIKTAAINCYQSQLQSRNYLNLSLGLNQFRAAKHLSDCNYAEVLG